jgi:thioredoxin 1
VKNIETRTDFDREIGGEGDKLVLFHSSYCPFCVSFVPVFEKRAKAGAAFFAKVSTDALPELEDAFSIEVVPTLLFFKAGRLASRLDGVLGVGLSDDKFLAFAAACGAPGEKRI